MKLIVLEVNEVPPRIFIEYCRRKPKSHLARLINSANGLIETDARDVEKKFLYPSQTWASFNTGLPYRTHNLQWYNDNKDYREFHWLKAAEKGKTVVLVNTLHSSPLSKYSNNPNLKTVIPDCFSSDSDTLPSDFKNFQKFSRSIATENGRKSKLVYTLKKAIVEWLKSPSLYRWGLGATSIWQLIDIVIGALGGRSERLRCAQFPLLCEIFLRSVKKHNPDIGVIFTNHVAAIMHRYWYAAFPKDFDTNLYQEAWITKYKNEIWYAMDLLDVWVGKISKYCEYSDKTLIISTSMGQEANSDLNPELVHSRGKAFRFESFSKFAAKISLSDGAVMESAMAPQITIDVSKCLFPLGEIAERIKSSLSSAESFGVSYLIDINDTKFTISLHLNLANPEAEIWAREAGLSVFMIDDHHSGRHSPIGTIIVYNDRHNIFTQFIGKRIDYLNYSELLGSALFG